MGYVAQSAVGPVAPISIYRAACFPPLSALQWSMSTITRQKITFAEMRASGVHGVLIYCSDYRCSHHIAVTADQWADDVRISDIEPRFVCTACGKHGADIRPDFPSAKMGIG